MTSVLLAILVAATASVQEPAKGRLCIAEKKTVLTDGTCRDVKGMTFEVAPAEHERLFLWTSTDGRNAQIGTVAAKANSVPLESDARRELKVMIRGEASRGWPVETKVSFRTPADAWRWTVPARAISRLEKIALPAGQYSVELLAEHHVPLRRRANVTEKITDAGEYRLDPVVQIRGRVADAEDKPLSATVSLADGKFCVATDEQGAFVCELPERDHLIAVAAAGFGTREIVFDRASGTGGTIDAGIIRLTKGQALTVKVLRDPTDQRPIKLTLLSDVTDEYQHTRIATRELAAGDEKARFQDLAPGRYLIVASGTEPLERVTVVTEMKTGEEGVAEVKIDPFRLDGSAHYGEEPITQGTIDIVERERGWRESLPLGPDGSFGGSMWQKGSVLALVGPQPETRELISSPPLGADPSLWNIQIAKREITGRIIDAETKQPVQNASMDLSLEFGSDNARGQMVSSVPVRADSTYFILASRPGTYRLTAKAPDYMSNRIELQIADGETSKILDIPLDRGVAQPLEFMSTAGTPILRVQILEGVRSDRLNPAAWSLSEGNKATVRGRPGETRLLYFAPNDGSFAFSRIVMPSDVSNIKPIQIVIPPPVGSLLVRTVDTDDLPAPARILIRYGGEFIPPAILRMITGQPFGTTRSGEDTLRRLPAGSYELWALGSIEDELQLIASNGSIRQPAQVGLSGGQVNVWVRVPKQDKGK